MNEEPTNDQEALISFWDSAFAMTEESRQIMRARDWRDIAPARKLFAAAESLGSRKRVLDYGCGSAWAAVIAAKSGCADVTAVDPAGGAIEAARFRCSVCGVQDRVRLYRAGPEWLRTVPSGTYDGLICSNVLDVVPPEIAEEIIRESARAVTRDADVIIGLNYYLSPEAAAERGMALQDGRRLYVDGVLRLVSRTDGEWEKCFSPFYTVEELEHFAWPGEKEERRRLFHLRKRTGR